MDKDNNYQQNFKKIEKSLQHLIAIQLYNSGVSQEEIGKHLGIAKGSASKLLKGIKRTNNHE